MPDTPKKWRILVFMATESPALAEAAKADLFELATAMATATKDHVAVLVQVHGYSLADPHHRSVRRYEIKDTCIPEGELTEEEPLRPTAGSITRFVKWGLTKCSDATDTLLLFWGHARGVGRDLAFADRALWPVGATPITDTTPIATKRVPSVALGAAALAGIRVSPTVLARALMDGFNVPPSVVNPIALLVFDSCFMASAEVAAEFNNLADYVIASQTAVALPALDLGHVVKAVVQAGAEGAAAVGKAILQQADEPDSHFHSLSLLQPSKTEAIKSALKHVVEQLQHAMLAGNQAEHVLDAFAGARFHRVRQFVDIVHLAERLDSAPGNLQRAGEGVAVFQRALFDARNEASAKRPNINVSGQATMSQAASDDAHGQAAELAKSSDGVHGQAAEFVKSSDGVHGQAAELAKSSDAAHSQGLALEKASSQVHADAEALAAAVTAASPDVLAKAEALVKSSVESRDKAVAMAAASAAVRDQAAALEKSSHPVHSQAVALEKASAEVYHQALALEKALDRSAENLSKAAAALYDVVQPRDDGFLVATRPLRSRKWLGGVSLFCPWLRAVPREMTPRTLDVVVNTDDYKQLALCRDTGWGAFAIGLDEVRHDLTRRVVAALPPSGCCCTGTGAGHHTHGPRPLKPHDLGVSEAEPEDHEDSDGFDEIDRHR